MSQRHSLLICLALLAALVLVLPGSVQAHDEAAAASTGGPSGVSGSGGVPLELSARANEYKVWAKNPQNNRGWVLYAYATDETLPAAKAKVEALRRAGWLARITLNNQVVY